MRRLRRNLWRGLGLAALLGVGLGATAAAGWLAPFNHWVERRLLAELRVLGVETEATHLRELSWRRAVVGPVTVRLPGLELRTEEARAELGWRVLLRRAAPQVVLSGVEIDVQADRLAELRGALQPQAGGFPYGRLTLEHSRAVIRRGRTHLELPFSGSVDSRVEEFRADLIVEAPALAGRLSVRGDLGEGAVELGVHDLRVAPAAWQAVLGDLLPVAAAGLGFEPAAQIRVSGTATFAGGTWRTAAVEAELPALHWRDAAQTANAAAGRLTLARRDGVWQAEWRTPSLEWISGDRSVRLAEPAFALEREQMRLRFAGAEATAPQTRLGAAGEVRAWRAAGGPFGAEARLQLKEAAVRGWRLVAPAELQVQWNGRELALATAAIALDGPCALQLVAVEATAGGWAEGAPRLRAQAQVAVDCGSGLTIGGAVWRLEPALVAAKATVTATLDAGAEAARVELSLPAQHRTLAGPAGRAEAVLGGDAVVTVDRSYLSGRATFEARELLARGGTRSLLAPEATVNVRWPRVWLAAWANRAQAEPARVARDLWWAGDYELKLSEAVLRDGTAWSASGVALEAHSRGAELHETGGLVLGLTATEATLAGAPRLTECHLDFNAGLAGGTLQAGCTVPELGLRPSTEQTVHWGDGFALEGKFGFDPVVLTGKEPLARWWPQLDGVELTGGAGLSAEDRYADGAWTVTGALLLQDLNVRLPAQAAVVEGLRGRIAWQGPQRWATAPDQTLTYQRATFGAVELTNGNLGFGLTAPGLLTVSRFSTGGLGGVAECAPFTCDLRRPGLETRVSLRGVRLEQLLRLVDDVPAEAVGAVDGSVPLRWRDGHLGLGTGYLRLAPGESGRVHFTRDLRLLTSGRRPGGAEYTALRRVEQAMMDLFFDRLRIDLYPQGADGQSARIRMVGVPGDGEHKMPIELDVNVNAPLEHFLNWGRGRPTP